MDLREWNKRIGYVVTIAGLILVSFIGRLYQKSVIEHATKVQAAESQYTSRKEVIGQRGQIVVPTNSGTAYFPLATNERRYQILAVPKNIKDPKKTAQQLAPILGISEQDLRDKIDNDKLYIPPLQHRLTREQADKIAALKLRGVLLLPELVRTYPENGLAAQVLGFVNNDGQGNYGLEQAYDFVLRGSEGYQVAKKDNQGRLIRLGDEVKAKDGSTLVLTIDRELQYYTEKALAESVTKYEADGGSVIIMNPKTGAILAMASNPAYDPNNFRDVPKDKQGVFINPAVSEVWEPGSIMKPLVMALAIDHKMVEPDTKETFGASVRVLNHDIYTAEKKAFGTETMTQVLENSDNVGMVWISNKLGNDKEYEGLKKFGFGTAPDIKFKNVVGGYLSNVKTWNDLTRATISFGQGVSTSPLQMVMAYSALANNGVMMKPYIVASVQSGDDVIDKTEPKEVGRVVSEETSKKLGVMLESVVLNGHGKRAKVPGYRIGGKTGTAQVPNPQGGYYEDRHIGSFAGYFPISDPKYAMVVKLNNPKNVEFAESSAAPTFGQIAAWLLSHKQVPQDNPQSMPH